MNLGVVLILGVDISVREYETVHFIDDLISSPCFHTNDVLSLFCEYFKLAADNEEWCKKYVNTTVRLPTMFKGVHLYYEVDHALTMQLLKRGLKNESSMLVKVPLLFIRHFLFAKFSYLL